MAKEIELGLSLKGTDAREFHKYMEHPDDTEAGRELIREALRLSNRKRTLTEHTDFYRNCHICLLKPAGNQPHYRCRAQ